MRGKGLRRFLRVQQATERREQGNTPRGICKSIKGKGLLDGQFVMNRKEGGYLLSVCTILHSACSPCGERGGEKSRSFATAQDDSLKSRGGSGAVAGLAEVFRNAEGSESTEKRRGEQELREAGGVGGANMRNGSREMDYCQDTVLRFDHSNVRRGSGMDGRSWREIWSLVRRERQRLEDRGWKLEGKTSKEGIKSFTG